MRSGRWSSSPILARLAVAGLAVLVLSFSGCSSGGGSSSVIHGVTLNGRVHGGQQGVDGATIQLYSVGTTGYGSTATALITTGLPVTTSGGGYFTITGRYSCTTGTQVYIVSSGGNPGLMAGTNNTALVLMTGLGDCGSLNSGTFININEVTTAASVFALAPFMTGGPTAVGSSSTNSQGIANAFLTINSLVNTATGVASGPGLAGGGTAPVNELNSLADIIAPCVNSNGTDGTCSGLFSTVHTVGGNPPTTTLDAMLSIAQNPGYQVSAVYNEATGTPPFTPVLPVPPNDWTLPITYTGGGLNGPFFLAIDGSGNVWVSNNFGSSVSKFTNNGSAISGPFGFNGVGGINTPSGIAIDSSGHVWVSDNTNPGAVTEFDSSGNALSPSAGWTGGGLLQPTGIAVDPGGNVWQTNFHTPPTISRLSEFNGSTGTAISTSAGYTGGGLNDPVGLAIAPVTGIVWVTNEAGSSLSEFPNNGTGATNIPFSDQNGLSSPQAIAIDASGNLWVADASGDISKLDSSGGPLGVFFTGVTPTAPYSILVDGVGNVWMPDAASNAVFELSPSGSIVSPTGSYTAGGTLDGPLGSGIDASGNLWLPNSGANTLTKIVGVAAPVITPLATAVAGSKLGVRP